MKKTNYLILISIFFIFGCSNNSEDDLTISLTSNTTKYTQNIKPIIDNNCVVYLVDFAPPPSLPQGTFAELLVFAQAPRGRGRHLHWVSQDVIARPLSQPPPASERMIEDEDDFLLSSDKVLA